MMNKFLTLLLALSLLAACAAPRGASAQTKTHAADYIRDAAGGVGDTGSTTSRADPDDDGVGINALRAKDAHAGWRVENDGTVVIYGALDGTNIAAVVSAIGPAQKTLRVEAPQTVAADLTVPTNVTLTVDGTGSFTVASGKLLNIEGEFIAPNRQVFFGAGTVMLCAKGSLCYTEVARAEWFGAQPDGATASAAAINKTLAAHPNVELLRGTYVTGGTPVAIPDSLHDLTGQGSFGKTILLTNSATADILRVVGPPGGSYSSGTWFTDVNIKGLQLSRSVAPHTPTGAGADTDAAGPAGLRVQRAIRVNLTDINTQNDFHGFYLNNTVQVTGKDLFAQRWVGAGSDRYIGIDLDCLTNATAPISTNASTRLYDCKVNAPYAGDSIGLFLNGHVSDQYVYNFECDSSVKKHAWVKGVAGDPWRQQVDVHFNNPILDGYKDFGLKIQDLTPAGQLSINGGHASSGPSATGASVGLYVSNSIGVHASGFKVNGGWGTTIGVALDAGSTHNVLDVNVQDCAQPVLLSFAGQNEVTGEVSQVTKAPTQPAVSVYGATAGRNYIRMGIVAGSDVKFLYSVYIDATARGGNEVNVTRVDPNAHTTARVREGATNITAVGTTPGGNTVTGVW